MFFSHNSIGLKSSFCYDVEVARVYILRSKDELNIWLFLTCKYNKKTLNYGNFFKPFLCNIQSLQT